MSLHRFLCAAVAAVVALVAPGVARSAWQGEEVPGTAGASPPRSFEFDRQGRALIVFDGFDQQRSPARFTGRALRAPGGGWSRLPDIGGIGWGAARVHLYARTRALLITRQVTGYGRFNRARFRLVWAVGRTNGTFGAFRPIDSSADVPSSAANGAGDAIVAYTPQGAAGVRVSERAAGQDFGRPRVLSGLQAIDPVVAMNARGDRVVAWYSGDRLQARIRRADAGWSAVRTAAHIARSENAPLRALVTPNGRIVLAWETVAVREDQPVRLEAGVAIRPASSGWHSALLERSVLATQSFAGEPAAIPVVDTSGDVLVAWTGRWQAATGVRIANLSASARISGTTLLSAETQAATLDDLAAGPQDRVAVTYAEQLANAGVRTWALLRQASGAFQPPEPLTPEGETGLAGSRVAFSPLTAQAVVVRPLVSSARSALAAAVPSDAARTATDTPR